MRVCDRGFRCCVRHWASISFSGWEPSARPWSEDALPSSPRLNFTALPRSIVFIGYAPSRRFRPARCLPVRRHCVDRADRPADRSFRTAFQFGNFISIRRFMAPLFGSPCRRHVVHRTALTSAFLLLAASACEAESGLASYYGGRGSSGEMTCAHRTRPFGSIVTVTHAGHSIQCRVNDRGPFIRGRVIDVSISAARALGMMRSGVLRVSVD